MGRVAYLTSRLRLSHHALHADAKTNQPVDFIAFARTEGRFARHFDAQGLPDPFLLQAQQDRLNNWRLLQELAGLR